MYDVLRTLNFYFEVVDVMKIHSRQITNLLGKLYDENAN